jgi:hypothetical protein
MTLQGLIDDLQTSVRESRHLQRSAHLEADASGSNDRLLEQIGTLEKQVDDFKCTLAQKDALLAALKNRDAEMRVFIEACRAVSTQRHRCLPDHHHISQWKYCHSNGGAAESCQFLLSYGHDHFHI